MFVVVLLSAMVTASAEGISREEARQKAATFLEQQGARRQLAPLADGQRLSRQRRSQAAVLSEYYVFNIGTREGYVIVSGDDRTEAVLGYADEGTFDYDALPPAMQELLERYTRQIAALQQMPDDVSAARGGRRLAGVPTHPKVEQMLTCRWNQGSPFNRCCPKDNTGKQSVTGCVATAMAQILYYYREKMVTETQADIPGYTTWTQQFPVSGIKAGAPLEWESMRDDGGASGTETTAVGNLMLYCGVSVEMDYTSSSSGAQINMVPGAMVNYFGMSPTARFIWGEDYSDTDWDALVYNDLAAGRPVYMGGYTGDYSMGHAFVCDGYDGNRRYHINWGWGGSADGYYMLTNLTPGQQGIGGNDDGHGYSTGPNVVVGIEPLNYATRAMTFSDVTLKRLCKANFDADGDGNVTYGEAALVKDLGTVFQGQRIQKFPELYYFTGLETIADDAFKGCTSLTTLRLPKGLKQIGNGAFSGCTKLTTMTLPSGLTTIGSEAFLDCKALTDITLPTGLATIGDGAFKGCVKLEEVVLPISMQTIGSGAFADCAALTSVAVKTFSPTALALGTGVFEGMPLQTATLSVMQGTQDWFTTAAQWCDFGTISVERELSQGKFVKPVQGETYYLYHVGTGQYLTKGEAWGTQAVVGNEPMRYQLRQVTGKPEGIYHLVSDDTERTGHYLFRTSTDSKVGQGVNACFVDGSNATAASYWQVAQVKDSRYGDEVYTIQVSPTSSDIGPDRYLGVQTDHESKEAQPTYGVYPDVPMAGQEANCLWRFVPYDEAVKHQYKNVTTLGNLIELAHKRGLKTPQEKAVYENIQSTTDDIILAQRSLRRRMSLVHFGNTTVQQAFVDLGDTNSDGELSFAEAEVIKDLNVSLKADQTLTSLDALRYFYSLSSIPSQCFMNCKNLRTVTLGRPDPADIDVPALSFAGVPLEDCTLRVPLGCEEKYRNANVWKDFGKIVGYRSGSLGETLEKLLQDAAAAGLDTGSEQAVYDNPESGITAINSAISSLRKKLNYIEFSDEKAETICLENWDASMDGELSMEEAAAVTTIGEAFRNVPALESLEELRYFTGLTEIPSSAFRNSIQLQTVFLPAGVKSIGEFAFTGCSDLKYLVILNNQTMVPQQLLGLPSKGTTIFVPSAVYDAYRTDSAWSTRCWVSEYTGHPVVTAEATRLYSYTSADIVMRVAGAPVDGEAAYACAEIGDGTKPVGTYTITVKRGSITNDDVELHDGVLTIEPVTVKVTAKSYQRNVGEPNPDFEVTYLRFRNKENASVLTKQPTISCEATIDSPAGEYPITVSGAEAQNYVFTYVNGVLTVVDPTPVTAPRSDAASQPLYDLQGRRIMQPRKGLYVRGGRKVVVN